MLTVMCPNCRHRFPAAGCCEPTTTTTTTSTSIATPTNNTSSTTARTAAPLGQQQRSTEENVACYYGGGLLVPRSAAGCFINAPTIVNGPAIIQTGQQQSAAAVAQILGRTKFALEKDSSVGYRVPTECHMTTSCDLTGGSVTITTPGIQSGGCLIQSTDSGILVQPHIEVRPKLSGGGVLVQKRLSMDEEEEEEHLASSPILIDDGTESIGCPHAAAIPSGCQELPGIRRNSRPRLESCRMHRAAAAAAAPPQCNCCREQIVCRKSSSCCCRCCCSNSPNLRTTSGGFLDGVEQDTSFCKAKDNFNDVFGKCSANRDAAAAAATSSSLENPNGLQIQVNATVQLPASLGQCTLNITATTTTTSSPAPGSQRVRNNFNGGGLVQADGTVTTSSGGGGSSSSSSSSAVSSGINPGNVNANERRDGAPSTPVSWLMPCPWGFDSYLADREDSRLTDVKRLLQMSGWYHDGLSWQQSESLLKNAPVGRWLVRDSSDSRYTFAVSVQTSRGPTSVRVHYFLGRFRLDAEPRLALAMPVFDCPIKMLEYYVNYSKRIDQREQQVWVDYSGQLYSQIYLTKPLVKEVRSLSHLARLAVNRNKLPTEQLPPLIKNYLAEYPYTL